tara:strand:- start:5423 stop:5797 length:375 start_codon:yes stop_codon:yes gene_type:complete
VAGNEKRQALDDFSKMDEKKKLFLAEILTKWAKADDIATCDGCAGYSLTEHMIYRRDNMLCPECDLPANWSSSFSERNHRRYYIYFDPAQPATRRIQWGHPTEGNPLYRKGDKGEVVNCKRKLA